MITKQKERTKLKMVCKGNELPRRNCHRAHPHACAIALAQKHTHEHAYVERYCGWELGNGPYW